MPVTRDPNFPVEIANLMQAFNHCADDHSADVVLNASLQMLAAAIGFVCKQKHSTLAEVEACASRVADTLHRIVIDNWDRPRSTTDIEVKLG